MPIVGAPQVPACKETINSFVTFAYAGPLDLLDARTKEPIFLPLNEAGTLPQEVKNKLPEGYGIRVKRPSYYKPRFDEPRQGYASGYAQNGWLLAQDSVVECIDSFEKCLADQTGEFSKHYNYNDIFFLHEDTSVQLYLMWWMDNHKHDHYRWFDDDYDWPHKRRKHRTLIDASITTGVVDQFIVGDYINIGITGPFSANGRYIHGSCNDPRQTGKVDMTIESNN